MLRGKRVWGCGVKEHSSIYIDVYILRLTSQLVSVSVSVSVSVDENNIVIVVVVALFNASIITIITMIDQINHHYYDGIVHHCLWYTLSCKFLIYWYNTRLRITSDYQRYFTKQKTKKQRKIDNDSRNYH